MESQRKIIIAIGLTLFFLAFGTLGYVKLEHYTLLDAFYMTVITITTVGYGEVNELSRAGRIFTVFLIMSGVGSVAFAAAAFTESVIERASNPNLKKKAMKRKISKLRGHFIICGYGRVGAASSDFFYDAGVDFVIIESSESQQSIIQEKGYYTLEGDATTEKTLLEAGIKNASGLLSLLDSDPDNLFTVLTARELNPTLKIISRTNVESSENRILRAGADSVISPFRSAGKTVAARILHGRGKSGSEYREKIGKNDWVTVEKESKLVSLEVKEANKVLGGTIVGVRSGEKDQLLPPADLVLEEGDEILVTFFVTKKQKKTEKGEARKIVLVDDNPVIRRLYTRLFQKAGFTIYTTECGCDGVDLIKNIVPDVAVVDYMLPDISGIEVCGQIRKDNVYDSLKLILFTTDEQEKTKQRALDIGVDKVVIKSPEATEIIAMVKEVLG